MVKDVEIMSKDLKFTHNKSYLTNNSFRLKLIFLFLEIMIRFVEIIFTEGKYTDTACWL